MISDNIFCVAFTTFCCFAMMGCILLPIYVQKDNENENNHKNQYITTNALVTYIERGDYTCYRERDCDNCGNGSPYHSCNFLRNNGTVGPCQRDSSLCCQEKCYHCYREEDRNGNSHEVCDRCGDRSIFCNDRCYCQNRNYEPLCYIISGTCYEPIVSVQFSDIMGNLIRANATKSCDIEDISCAINFIGDRQVGGQTEVEYEKNNPQNIYLNGKPNYETNSDIMAAIVFGSLFIIIAFGACVVACIYAPHECCYDINCDCCCAEKEKPIKYEIETPFKLEPKSNYICPTDSGYPSQPDYNNSYMHTQI